MSKKRNRHVGSALDDLLAEDRVQTEASAVAVKRVLAWQIGKSMAKAKIGKAEMARRMGTSRAALDRLLDPASPSVTLLTMDKAAAVLGKRLKVELIDRAA